MDQRGIISKQTRSSRRFVEQQRQQLSGCQSQQEQSRQQEQQQQRVPLCLVCPILSARLNAGGLRISGQSKR